MPYLAVNWEGVRIATANSGLFPDGVEVGALWAAHRLDIELWQMEYGVPGNVGSRAIRAHGSSGHAGNALNG